MIKELFVPEVKCLYSESDHPNQSTIVKIAMIDMANIIRKVLSFLGKEDISKLLIYKRARVVPIPKYHS